MMDKKICNIPRAYTSWMFANPAISLSSMKTARTSWQQSHPSNGCSLLLLRDRICHLHMQYIARRWGRLASEPKWKAWGKFGTAGAMFPATGFMSIFACPQCPRFLKTTSHLFCISISVVFSFNGPSGFITTYQCWNIYYSLRVYFTYSISPCSAVPTVRFQIRKTMFLVRTPQPKKHLHKKQRPLKTPQGLRWEGTLGSGTLGTAVSCSIMTYSASMCVYKHCISFVREEHHHHHHHHEEFECDCDCDADDHHQHQFTKY